MPSQCGCLRTTHRLLLAKELLGPVQPCQNERGCAEYRQEHCQRNRAIWHVLGRGCKSQIFMLPPILCLGGMRWCCVGASRGPLCLGPVSGCQQGAKQATAASLDSLGAARRSSCGRWPLAQGKGARVRCRSQYYAAPSRRLRAVSDIPSAAAQTCPELQVILRGYTCEHKCKQ